MTITETFHSFRLLQEKVPQAFHARIGEVRVLHVFHYRLVMDLAELLLGLTFIAHTIFGLDCRSFSFRFRIHFLLATVKVVRFMLVFS